MTLIEHVYAAQNELGEGPLWHPEEQALYWVDLLRGQVYRLDPLTREVQQWAVGEMVGCLGLRRDGGLVMANRSSIATWAPGGTRSVIATLDPSQVGDRFNDGAVDPQGRFWVGSMSAQGQGVLIRVDANHSVHTLKTGVSIGNGIGWSPDRHTMYFTDSTRYAIYAYDFDPVTGSMSHERVFVDVSPDRAGVPDGLTVDRDGCIWSARWDGWKVVQYDPQGKVMQEIRLPVQRPTSCMFGGPNLDVLYVTSARLDLSASDLASQPQAGDLFRLHVDAVGLPEPFFAG